MRAHARHLAKWLLVVCATTGWLLAVACSDDESNGTGGAAGTTASGGAGAVGGAGGTARVEACLALCSHLASCSANPDAVAAHCNPECLANPASAQVCSTCLGPLSGEDCSNVPPCSSECARFLDFGGSGDAG